MVDNIELGRPQQPAGRRSGRRDLDRLHNAVHLLMRPALSTSDLLGRLAGKRVAIVGNAQSLAEKTYGAAIDGHDIVIRFNGVRIPSTVSHGARTDWVATAIPFDAADARQHGVKAVLWMTPNRKNLAPWMVRRAEAELYLHPPARNADLAARLGAARPSTGAMVIDLVMQSPDVAQVGVFGFDFFASQSLSGNHTAATAPHDFAKERDFIQKLAANDAKLSLMT